MRSRIVLAVIVGVILFAGLLTFLVSPPDAETDRYRAATEIIVDDHGREVRNTVLAECSANVSSRWNTGTQHSISRTGDEPFVVLGDRSLLLLGDLRDCLPSPPSKGDVYTYDVGLAAQSEDKRIRMPYSHARRFDNIDDPTSVKIYLQPELFRDGIDGLRIKDAKLSFAGRDVAQPLPFAGEDAFPWLASIPWAPVGDQNYGENLHLSTFSGFEIRLNQLTEAMRCSKFDKDAEGPILVEGDVWDSCPPWGGNNLGWLTAMPNADFSRLDYSYDRRSDREIATLYRANWLAAKGAPGARDVQDFYWQPELCFDGTCYRTHAERRSVWEGFRLYYPRKNQVITVNWKSSAASTMFRRREKSS